MTQEITILPTSGPLVGQTMPGPQTNHRQIDLAARAWLHTKSGKSGSLKTLRAYQDTLAAFRAALEAVGLDLDTPDPQRLALVAQVFAGGPEVAPATHNQRVAVLSSFYKFVLLRRLLPGVDANPMELVERRKAQSYARATSLDPADVRNHLGRLDRQTLAGARDYAILLVTLTTGRRVAEIAGLRLKDIKRVGGGKWIELHFRRCKGGKEMRDRLADPVAEALIGYLKLVYPSGSTDPDAPIWISLDQHGGTFGRALSVRALQLLCHKHLGDHYHALRHTFAREMENAGAKASDIQARLGHESLETTGRYLKALKRAENDKADVLADLFAG